MKLGEQVRCAVAGKDETCEYCGAQFRCGPLWNCWCFREKVPPAVLQDLKARYERCLCPECLGKAVQQALARD